MNDLAFAPQALVTDAAVAATGSDTRREQPLVLVVDDEPLMREMLEITLEDEGFAVESAADGVQGLASFERLNFGVALLNNEMQVLHLNQTAQHVIQRGDGLSLNTQQQFEGRTENAESSFQNLSSWLEAVRNMPLSAQPHFLQGAVVLRANGQEENASGHNHVAKKYYDMQCVPLPKTDTWFGQQQDARYVVFITDPHAVKLPGAARLHELYGLTAAQVKVTCELARGASYKNAAHRLRISEDTVRSHVKEIYRKTRVNRQADLVRLILSISQNGMGLG